MNIFVGNLSFDSTQGDVKKLFEGFGNVASAVIVMEKEKKAPKSRGFGFVQMPDEQQALAAIAALNGKEFMGRVLNVEPARPSPEVERDKGEAKKIRSEIKIKGQEHPGEEVGKRGAWYTPVFNKEKGRYKTGRRTRSYMKQHGLTEIQDGAKPRRRSQDNPMRWRKRKDQPKPWQRSPDEHKPWKKAEEGARPWKKAEGESKPWKKTGGEIRTWRKSGEEPKPWKKPAGEANHWRKGRERPQKSKFNPSTSLGMVRGNGERSRTKGRGKPGGYKR